MRMADLYAIKLDNGELLLRPSSIAPLIYDSEADAETVLEFNRTVHDKLHDARVVRVSLIEDPTP